MQQRASISLTCVRREEGPGRPEKNTSWACLDFRLVWRTPALREMGTQEWLRLSL